jgi:flagellar hook protein FlgE
MTFSVGSTLSALHALGTKMQVTSNNVANVYTDGFKKSQTTLVEGPNQTVQVEIDEIDTPGPIVYDQYDGHAVEREMSNVDLAEEIPQTVLIEKGYQANLKTLKVQDEMIGSLLDIIQ